MPTRTTVTLTPAPPFRFVVTTADTDGPTPTTTRTEYALHACTSVTCRCHEIQLVPTAQERTANTTTPSPAAPTPPPQLRADLATRTITPAAAHASPDVARTTQEIAKATKVASWLRLGQLFAAAKADAFAAFDGTQETADFPFAEIERDARMVLLRHVIPHAPQLIPPRDRTRELSVHEHYCVRPDCDCTRTVVGVNVLQPIDATRAESRPFVDFCVDWQRDHWTIAGDGRPLDAGERALRDGLVAANPDLFATLRQRHTMLRRLYAASAAAAGRTSAPRPRPVTAAAVASRAPRASRVGRNEPCPCGSGRKAKRCCYAN